MLFRAPTEGRKAHTGSGGNTARTINKKPVSKCTQCKGVFPLTSDYFCLRRDCTRGFSYFCKKCEALRKKSDTVKTTMLLPRELSTQVNRAAIKTNRTRSEYVRWCLKLGNQQVFGGAGN